MELAGVTQRPASSAEQRGLPEDVITASASRVHASEPNNNALACSRRHDFNDVGASEALFSGRLLGIPPEAWTGVRCLSAAARPRTTAVTAA